MPRVQSYGPRQVRTTPLPGARRQYAEETFPSAGGAVAEASARLGAQVGATGLQVYQLEQARADQMRLRDVDEELAAWEIERRSDPKTGWLTRRGIDALGVTDTVEEEFAKKAGDLRLRLPRRLIPTFDRFKAGRLADLRRWALSYSTAEVDQHDAQKHASYVQNAVQNGIAYSDDRNRVTLERDRVVAETLNFGRRNGWSPEAIAAETSTHLTALHTGVIGRLLAADEDVAAARYFERAKEEIAGAAYARIEAALEEGSLRGASQRAADEILAAGGTLTDQRATARAIADPKLRDAVMLRIEHEVAFADRQQREAYEGAHRQATNLLEQSGGDLRRIPPALWTSLSREDRAGLRSLAKDVIEGTPVKTDPNTYYFLSMLSTSSDPELRKQFLQTNILSFADRLSPEDRKHWIDIQSKTRQGDEAAAEKLLSNTANQNRMVDEALVSMGLVGSEAELREPENQVLAERIGMFRRAVREAVGRLEQRPDRAGKPATDEDVQSIIDQLRARTGTRVTKRGLFTDTTVPAFAFDTPQAHVASVREIPPAERRKIEAALRGRGLAITDQAVIELFNLQLAITRKDR